MLSLTLSGLSLPTLQLPLKGLSTTFGSAPASQKLFGLNSTNIGAAHPPASQPTHQIIEIVHGAKTETPKTVGPSVAGGAIGQQTGAASADGKYLYTLNDFYDGTAVTARVEQHSMADGSLVGVYPVPQVCAILRSFCPIFCAILSAML